MKEKIRMKKPIIIYRSKDLNLSRDWQVIREWLAEVKSLPA